MRARRPGAVALLATVLALTPLAACSDDDGRGEREGNVTSPPASLLDPDDEGAGDGGAQGTGEPGGGDRGDDIATLAGTAWLLRSLPDGGEVADTSDTPVPAAVTFGAETIDVYDGVNTVAGEYTLDGLEVTIRMGTASEFPYPDDDLPQYGLIEQLGRVERAVIEDRMLVLTTADGGEISFEQAAGATVEG